MDDFKKRKELQSETEGKGDKSRRETRGKRRVMMDHDHRSDRNP